MAVYVDFDDTIDTLMSTVLSKDQFSKERARRAVNKLRAHAIDPRAKVFQLCDDILKDTEETEDEQT